MIEEIVDRRRRTVLGRAVTLAATRLQNMNDPGDRTAIIDAPRTRLAFRHVRLNRRPLRILKPKKSGHPNPAERNMYIEKQPVPATSMR